MSHTTLNLGILAHVDAGKTTLTERLLYAAGVIDEIGSVDDGTTQTDTLALERARGITIKAAVVSFDLAGVTLNLIDTPGHPDFIAEVDRALSVLDGAVLVVSAVEGVQPQTLILMRALQRLSMPTLLFVNKIDRAGASADSVVESIARRLTPAVVPLGSVRAIGTRAADVEPFEGSDAAFQGRLATMLAERDDKLLAAFVADPSGVSDAQLQDELAVQSRRALVHPVFFGSALTGAGIEPLLAGITELLPATKGDDHGPVSGRVFKIERRSGGDNVAYVRMFSGTIRIRSRVRFGPNGDVGPSLEGKVTAISVFERGGVRMSQVAGAGQIAQLRGLKRLRVGDTIGAPGQRAGAAAHQFAPPTLMTVVVPSRPAEAARLRVALAELAEQDPLINVRQDPRSSEVAVSLYGEVQREVIQATLASDYGLTVTTEEVTPLCVERPIGMGDALEVLHGESNPYNASIGLRVEPAERDTGIEFRLDVDPSAIPLYIYKTAANFAARMEGFVRRTLEEGLFGWQVTDCLVTLTQCLYSLADGPPSRRGPLSTPGDFRHLTPIVLMEALARARTVACEPMLRITVEIPAFSVEAVTSALGHATGVVDTFVSHGDYSVITAVVPARRAVELQRSLPALTGGEGALESSFAGHAPVPGAPPTRRRSSVNPLDRKSYLASLGKRPRHVPVAGSSAGGSLGGSQAGRSQPGGR